MLRWMMSRFGAHIWLSLELCAGGSVADLARQLVKRGRRLIDDQIAYIVKEVLHALIYLQVILSSHLGKCFQQIYINV